MAATLTIRAANRQAQAVLKETQAQLQATMEMVQAQNAEIRAGAAQTIEAQGRAAASYGQVVRAVRANIEATANNTRATIDGVKLQLTALGELRSSYREGSVERQTLTKQEIVLQRQLAEMTNAAATGAARQGRAARGGAGMLGAGGRFTGSARAEETGVGRGFLSRSTGLGGWIAGPGFIAGAAGAIALHQASQALRTIEEEMSQLQGAVTNAGLSWDKYRGHVERTVKQMEAFGVKESDTLRGMTALVRVTGSVEKAQQQMALAVNISRGAHVSLEQAVMAVVQADNGRFRGLQRLIGPTRAVTTHMDQLKAAHIKVTDANREQVVQLQHQAAQLDKSATSEKVLALAQTKFAGEAERHMKTAEGATDRRRVAIEKLEVSVGRGLLPVEHQLSNAITAAADGMRHSHALAEALRNVGAGLALAFKAVSLVFEGLAWVLDNRVGRAFLQIAAIAVSPAGAILRHWDKLRGFFNGLWKFLLAGFRLTWDVIKIGALETYKAILKPFSHLPGRMGEWARRGKEQVNTEIASIKEDMGKQGELAGNAWGQAFVRSNLKVIAAGMKNLPAEMRDTLSIGAAPAAIAAGGRAGGLTKTAVQFGPESGITYHWGGMTPEQGFDCSGYLHYVYAQNGIRIPRSSSAQFNDPHAIKVKRNELKPGDGVYFRRSSSPGPAPQHCGIYIGGGNIIEYYTRGQPARFNRLSDMDGYMGARRWLKVVKETGGTDTGGGGTGAGAPPVARPVRTAAAVAEDTAFSRNVAAAQRTGVLTGPHKKSEVEKLEHQFHPMYGQRLVNYIATRAKALGVDPSAVLAVASVEGGFNGKVGDNGTSFGPFQLHIGGALPSSVANKGRLYAMAWANSAVGIDYALGLIAKVAGGTSGAGAVSLIVAQVERPADIPGEISRATARLGKTPYTVGGGALGPAATAAKAISQLRQQAADLRKLINDALAAPGQQLGDVFGRIGSDRATLDQLGVPISAASQALIEKLGRLRDRLNAMLRSGLVNKQALARLRAQIKEVGTTLANALDEETANAEKQRARLRAAVMQVVERRQQAALQQFDRATQAQIAAMRKTFEQAMKQFDKETQRGLQRFVVKETPEEAALRQFQEQRQAEQDAATMAQAVASGDPEQIRQANLDLQEKALDKAAQASREAQDKITQDQQDAYQEQRDALRETLDERENMLEQSYQDSRDIIRQSMDDANAAELEKLGDNLDQWDVWLREKAQRVEDFYAWLQTNYGIGPGDVPWQNNTPGRAGEEAIFQQLQQQQTGGRPTGIPMQRGGTLRAPRYIGRGDMIATRLGHNETVIDSSLTDALRAMVRGGGGGVQVVVPNALLLGRDREVARRIADVTKPEIERIISYKPTL